MWPPRFKIKFKVIYVLFYCLKGLSSPVYQVCPPPKQKLLIKDMIMYIKGLLGPKLPRS